MISIPFSKELKFLRENVKICLFPIEVFSSFQWIDCVCCKSMLIFGLMAWLRLTLVNFSWHEKEFCSTRRSHLAFLPWRHWSTKVPSGVNTRGFDGDCCWIGVGYFWRGTLLLL